MNTKSQAQIISFLLLIVIALSLISATYYWVVPRIEEMTDLNEVRRLENRMLDLNDAILNVAREKSRQSVVLRLEKGNLKVLEDRIVYSGFFNLPKEARGSEQILYGGIKESGRINCSGSVIGVLGEEEPVCLLRRGSVELELRYFYLNDTSTGNLHAIKFFSTTNSIAGKGSNRIVIKWHNRTVEGSNPKNITENILINIY